MDAERGQIGTPNHNRRYALYVLAVTTGLRQGELLDLQREDVDLGMATLFVQRQLQEVAGKIDEVEPKTKAGRRRVVLPRIAIDALRAHFDQQREDGYTGKWVFPATNGKPMQKSNLRRRSFAPLLAKADLAENAVLEDAGDDANPPELQESDEWSHVDSNHGPPACENGPAKIRRRPKKS